MEGTNMKKKEPAYVAATLKWCNERRKEKGKKPLKKMPKGRIADPSSCPCGRTADLIVGAEEWRPQGSTPDDYNPTPGPVRKFVYAFDAGRLPQYEL
jgi:hypothetical protein